MTPPSPAVDVYEAAVRALQAGPAPRNPRVRDAGRHLQEDRPGLAAKLLDEVLKAHPRDVHALQLMALAHARTGRRRKALALLAQCVELAPEFEPARYAYADMLIQLTQPEAALVEADKLLARNPHNALFRRLKAIALETIGEHAAAAQVWRALLDDHPNHPETWRRYGHALRATGRRDDAIAAYRTAIGIAPSFGGAWWALADLKSFRFSADDIALMEMRIARTDLVPEDRARLHFALGKAHADAASYEKSFAHYAKGNALDRLRIDHDPDVLTAYVARCKTLFTAEFYRARAGAGSQRADPIFLVGMLRAGSTLVEQILASHSQIEGTKELPELAALANHVQSEHGEKSGARYPEALAKLDPSLLRGLGEHYLESVQVHRKTDAPYFTDKMGPNFVHAGMIHLILPNAKIVDVRRHPLACGFSNFVQVFPNGQNDAYRLSDIGRTYRDYVALMAHIDRVLPGRVHRVIYEQLVADPETETRRLLAYLGLPFEAACLEFYKTDRVVTTASSEQVRSPIYRDAVEQWRHFEPWLGPLKNALGDVLTAYPDAPAEMG
ncbi:MAG: sulfotransferase [Rhizomicrobium sp.]|jgi:tetratricopeptide (TPR) repeat protein